MALSDLEQPKYVLVKTLQNRTTFYVFGLAFVIIYNIIFSEEQANQI